MYIEDILKEIELTLNTFGLARLIDIWNFLFPEEEMEFSKIYYEITSDDNKEEILDDVRFMIADEISCCDTAKILALYKMITGNYLSIEEIDKE